MDLRQFKTDMPPDQRDEFAALPKGDYPCIICDSVERETKAGTGAYLELTFEVIDGQYKGRKFWGRLNLRNPNPKAVEIAERDLSAICRAVGVAHPSDSRELHNLPLLVSVVTDNYGGKEKNEPKAYKPLNQRPVPAAAAQATTPPWQRG